jgi:hypothetical protein
MDEFNVHEWRRVNLFEGIGDGEETRALGIISDVLTSLEEVDRIVHNLPEYQHGIEYRKLTKAMNILQDLYNEATDPGGETHGY